MPLPLPPAGCPAAAAAAFTGCGAGPALPGAPAAGGEPFALVSVWAAAPSFSLYKLASFAKLQQHLLVSFFFMACFARMDYGAILSALNLCGLVIPHLVSYFMILCFSELVRSALHHFFLTDFIAL